MWYKQFGTYQMSERDAKTSGDRLPSRVERRPAYADSSWQPGMDPNYSSHVGPYPWDDMPATSVNSCPTKKAADFAYKQAWGSKRAEQNPAELLQQLRLTPPGQRIRNLRVVLGWTQAMAAVQLGISTRTVIRHEQGRNRRPWLRLPLLLRLCELESDHAEQLIAYLARVGPERA
jgi:DNA-binding XRE family transcriptional regulator